MNKKVRGNERRIFFYEYFERVFCWKIRILLKLVGLWLYVIEEIYGLYRKFLGKIKVKIILYFDWISCDLIFLN